MDERKSEELLRKSLVVMNVGSNDYINNFLIPSLYPNTSSRYNAQDYAHLLINHYTTHVLVRNFYIVVKVIVISYSLLKKKEKTRFKF